ncbi:MAG TPA: hypothetical protein VF401_01145 [Candidatus Saccharimonadales bacterium]
MYSTISKRKFYDSEEAVQIKAALVALEKDANYCTEASYSANEIDHPDSSISFVDKHMHYLSEHPKVNPQYYLSNLRLMTRVR